MNTLRRLIFREVAWAVAYVTLGFWALFFLFDLIDELRWVRSGPGGYTMAHALLSAGTPRQLRTSDSSADAL